MTEPSNKARETRNSVVLVGRVSAAPDSRELPSGDRLVTFRVVVDRPRARDGSRRQVDVIDVACWSRRTQRTATASRYEVEAERIARVSAARAASSASGG